MKINLLIAALALNLAPSAFSQQLIANSVTNSSQSSGLLCLGMNAAADSQGIAVGDWTQAGTWGVSIGSSSTAGHASMTLGIYNEAQNYSTAIGNSNYVTGFLSSALGYSNYVTSAYSTALGYWTGCVNDYSVALGSKNLGSTGAETPFVGWVEDSVLFELGNGQPLDGMLELYRDPAYLSNAITTLKNGQTTLTNKAWFNRYPTIPATSDPSSETTDSGGNALVVDGHTVLNGKVVITVPQGDISMGIYQ